MSYWTEKIPGDWEKEPLDKSVSNIVDNRGRTAPTAKSGIPLIATNCIKEFGLYPVFEKVRYIDQETYKNWFRGHPEPNDILFVNKGTPGGVCLVPDPVPFCIAQDMVALRADPKKFDWKYLFAALRSDFVRSQIEALNVGTSIPHLKKTDFNRIVIPKPTYKDQVTIGEIYFSLSQKIELNLQLNKTLEEMAMALYKHWFVDFGPFQDGEFVDSELGEIPKGWEVKSVGQIVKIIGGFAFKSKDFKETGETVIKIKNISNNVVSIEGSDCIGYDIGGKTNKKFLIHPGSFLIAMTGAEVGKVGVVPDYGRKLWLNQRVGMITAPTFESADILIGNFLQNSDGYETIQNLAYGSAQPNISTNGLEGISLPIPNDISIISEFLKKIDSWHQMKISNYTENQTLTQLRDTLLPKLISGEVRVKDVEKTLNEVL